MKIDYDIVRKELEKLSKKERLKICVLMPSNIQSMRKFYNLNKKEITPRVIFFKSIFEERAYNILISLKDFYDRYKRYPIKYTQKSKRERLLNAQIAYLRTKAALKENSKFFEFWCKELGLWDFFYKKHPTIIQYDLQGTTIKVWENTSVHDIAVSVGLRHSSSINNCLEGKKSYLKAGGYIWRYENDAFDKYKLPIVYLSFLEWQKICKINNIRSRSDYFRFKKENMSYTNKSMPYTAESYYKRRGEWPEGGWGEVFGTGRRRYRRAHILKEDIERIVFKGVSINDIASKYDCSRTCVQKKAQKYKIKNNISLLITITKYTTTGKKIKEVSGKSIKAISKIFKVSPIRICANITGKVKTIDGYVYRKNEDPFNRYPVKYLINYTRFRKTNN